jgi:hypothetical protein
LLDFDDVATIESRLRLARDVAAAAAAASMSRWFPYFFATSSASATDTEEGEAIAAAAANAGERNWAARENFMVMLWSDCLLLFNAVVVVDMEE